MDTDLAARRPHLVAEWHPRNERAPATYSFGSKVKVWWRCPRDPAHEWEASILNRARPLRPSGCPYCRGRRATAADNLAARHPHGRGGLYDRPGFRHDAFRLRSGLGLRARSVGVGATIFRSMTLLLHWGKMLALTTLAFLVPIKPLMIGAMVMVIFDTITGILAARKRGERISSAGLRRTVTKALIYTLAILSGHVAEKLLLESLVPVARLVAAAIGAVEIKSILENAQTVLGMTLFQSIMSKLGSNNDPRKPDAPPAPPAA